MLVTRARGAGRGLVRQLQALGALPIVVPTIDIVPPADAYAALDAALRDLSTFDWVVFTSVNGVLHVWERLAALGSLRTRLPRCRWQPLVRPPPRRCSPARSTSRWCLNAMWQKHYSTPYRILLANAFSCRVRRALAIPCARVSKLPVLR